MTQKNKTEAEDSFRIASKMRTVLGPFKMLSTEDSSVAERLYLRLTDGIGQLNELICISVRDYVYKDDLRAHVRDESEAQLTSEAPLTLLV